MSEDDNNTTEKVDTSDDGAATTEGFVKVEKEGDVVDDEKQDSAEGDGAAEKAAEESEKLEEAATEEKTSEEATKPDDNNDDGDSKDEEEGALAGDEGLDEAGDGAAEKTADDSEKLEEAATEEKTSEEVTKPDDNNDDGDAKDKKQETLAGEEGVDKAGDGEKEKEEEKGNNGGIEKDEDGKLEEDEINGKNDDAKGGKAPAIKAAPQAAEGNNEDAGEDKQKDYGRQETDGSFEDCNLTPLDTNKQRLTMKLAMEGGVLADEGNNDKKDDDGAHVKISEQSNETYSIPARDGIPKPPFNDESPPRQDDAGADKQSTPSPFTHEGEQPKQPARKPKFKKPSIRFTAKKNHSIKDTTAPPESSSFKHATQKLKHNILNSIGEFLNSAFADDEETSGSYFSQDLLDQLSKSDPTIKGVWLQAKSLNDNHIQQLCESLIRNKVVTEVWLPSNNITDVGAAHIAHMLKFNKSIKELFLGENHIGPKGAAALATALARGNTTLVALGMGDNQIGVEGAGAFAAALRHNHSLHTLDIKGNGIPRNSSIRGLLHKMLEFNASDPGDESLVIGLQEELSSLVANLPPDVAEDVVLQAEHALKTAIICRKKGDKIGAAEAEGLFIRICTTGQKPEDPPEMTVGRMGGPKKKQDKGSGDKKHHHRHHQSQGKAKKDKVDKKPRKPSEPDRLDDLNQELSTLKFHDEGCGAENEEGTSDVAASNVQELNVGEESNTAPETEGNEAPAAEGGDNPDDAEGDNSANPTEETKDSDVAAEESNDADAAESEANREKEENDKSEG